MRANRRAKLAIPGKHVTEIVDQSGSKQSKDQINESLKHAGIIMEKIGEVFLWAFIHSAFGLELYVIYTGKIW
jgi:hypothetical protein